MPKVFILTLIAAQSETIHPDIRDAVVDLCDGDCIVAHQGGKSFCMLFRTELGLGSIAARLDSVLPDQDSYFISALGGESLFYRLGHVSAWLQNPLPGTGLDRRGRRAKRARSKGRARQDTPAATEPPVNPPMPASVASEPVPIVPSRRLVG
jgi:hypothetical protein